MNIALLHCSALALLSLTVVASATITQVNFNSGDITLMDNSMVALTAGGDDDGDGAVIQLGYYSAATTSNPFLGTWIALTGDGSANTGGEYNADNSPPSPLRAFNFTSIGDVGGGSGASGVFGIAVKFDSATVNTTNNLPGSTSIPLAIRFYNATTVSGSTHYNTVSNTSTGADNWLWKAPTSDVIPPQINMALDSGSVTQVWEGGVASAGITSIPTAVPEPVNFTVGAMALLVAGLSRRRYRTASPIPQVS
jgi:hypothetical protein